MPSLVVYLRPFSSPVVRPGLSSSPGPCAQFCRMAGTLFQSRTHCPVQSYAWDCLPVQSHGQDCLPVQDPLPSSVVRLGLSSSPVACPGLFSSSVAWPGLSSSPVAMACMPCRSALSPFWLAVWRRARPCCTSAKSEVGFWRAGQACAYVAPYTCEATTVGSLGQLGPAPGGEVWLNNECKRCSPPFQPAARRWTQSPTRNSRRPSPSTCDGTGD